MEAPVVVKPEIVSKKASVKEGINPLIIKGREPKKLIMIHVSETIRKPYLLLMLSLL